MILAESPHWPRRGKSPGQSVARRFVLNRVGTNRLSESQFRGEIGAKWPFSGRLRALAAIRVMSSFAVSNSAKWRSRPYTALDV